MKLRTYKFDSGGFQWRLYPGEQIHGHEYCHGETYFGKPDFALTAEFNAQSERTATLHIAIPWLFSIYFGIDRKWGYSDRWRKLLRLDEDHRYGGRLFGLSWLGAYGCVDGGSFRLSLGERVHEWNSKDPKWYSILWYPLQTLCGPAVFTECVVSRDARTVTIPGHDRFPTKDYELTATMSKCTWTWKRFKKPLVITRCEVKCKEGVAHPGKGTTDYNCDDTALFSSCFPCDNFDEAYAKFLASVHESRTKMYD